MTQLLGRGLGRLARPSQSAAVRSAQWRVGAKEEARAAVLHAWTMSKPHNSRHSSFLPSFNARRSAAADGKRIVPVMRAARCSSTEGGAEGEVVVHEYTASPARADVDKKRFSCERFSYGYRS